MTIQRYRSRRLGLLIVLLAGLLLLARMGDVGALDLAGTLRGPCRVDTIRIGATPHTVPPVQYSFTLDERRRGLAYGLWQIIRNPDQGPLRDDDPRREVARYRVDTYLRRHIIVDEQQSQAESPFAYGGQRGIYEVVVVGQQFTFQSLPASDPNRITIVCTRGEPSTP